MKFSITIITLFLFMPAFASSLYVPNATTENTEVVSAELVYEEVVGVNTVTLRPKKNKSGYPSNLQVYFSLKNGSRYWAFLSSPGNHLDPDSQINIVAREICALANLGELVTVDTHSFREPINSLSDTRTRVLVDESLVVHRFIESEWHNVFPNDNMSGNIASITCKKKDANVGHMVKLEVK